MAVYEGLLTVNVNDRKGTKSFKAKFVNAKGKEQNLSIQPSVCFFDQNAAAPGDKAIIEMNDTGQIVKCEIPGKPGAPAQKNKQDASRQTYPAHGGYQKGRSGGDYGGKSGGHGGGADNKPLVNAKAPYNFAPYERDAVLPAFTDEERRWSGVIKCRLVARAPLLVSGKQHKKNENSATECEFLRVNGKAVIPGSSLKGMLRSLIEIMSFSAMAPVTDKPIFWRLVSRPKYLAKFPEKILGGYLFRSGATYTLKPADVERIEWNEEASHGKEKVETGGFCVKGIHSPAYAFSRNPKDQTLEVPHKIVDTFLAQLTDNQKRRWKKGERLARDGHPVFYRVNEFGKITELGLCRFFRLRYEHAPKELAKPEPDPGLDIATKIFGSVSPVAFKGRVAVTPAFVTGDLDRAEGHKATLGAPKPSCLPLYLRQNLSKVKRSSHGKKGNDPADLTTYDSPDARLRGHKLYWHHDVKESLFPKGNDSEKVMSRLFPLAKGASAEFEIHVDKLTDVELGALFAALELPKGHMHKLGMGKSLGFGSVRLDIIAANVFNVADHYASLAARLAGAAAPEMDKARRDELKDHFCSRVFSALKALGKTGDAKGYEELETIKALRLMQDYDHRPKPEQVATMRLEEFALHAILPRPEFVDKI